MLNLIVFQDVKNLWIIALVITLIKLVQTDDRLYDGSLILTQRTEIPPPFISKIAIFVSIVRVFICHSST